jgi:G3E family GTPase
VASLKDVVHALGNQRLAAIVDMVRTVLVLDVDDYDWFTQLAEEFVAAQIEFAQLILLNKTDLAPAELPDQVAADLERRNPAAVIWPTTYGAFEWGQVEDLLPALGEAGGHSTSLAGFESFSSVLTESFSLEALRGLLQDIADGRYGEVRRAKGIFMTPGGCFRLDLASGRFHESPWQCPSFGRINVVGRGLDQSGLQRALRTAIVRSELD